MEGSLKMENCEPELSCQGYNIKGFTLRDLLEHKKVCPDRVCVICMDKQACSILEPCLHKSCCAECIYRILQNSNKCPICRSVVVHVHGEISYNSKDTLEKAAKIAIVNYVVVTQGEALAIVQWQHFMASYNNEHLRQIVLQKIG